MEKKLLTLRAKIEDLKKKYNSMQRSLVLECNSNNWKEIEQYANFLDQTITEDMFVGDEAIFEGFEEYHFDHLFFLSNGYFIVTFDDNIPYVSNSYLIGNYKAVRNLLDLAELTKENTLNLK